MMALSTVGEVNILKSITSILNRKRFLGRIKSGIYCGLFGNRGWSEYRYDAPTFPNPTAEYPLRPFFVIAKKRVAACKKYSSVKAAVVELMMIGSFE
jgi:hypothetical protein